MGALDGVKVIEFAGLGPAPFCGMMLADHGAEVIRIDRKGGGSGDLLGLEYDILNRGRRSLAVDLKQPAAVAMVLRLIDGADIVLEGFRPGVMERLGVGPDVCLARRPSLVYGRMTGWGQSGPLAPRAGHDLNYIAITGALHGVGDADRPAVPLNLIGDFGGGAMMLAFGLLAALVSARTTGQGQVVDCAMSDGAAALAAMIYGLRHAGQWSDQRRANLLDGGAPFYDCYRCADGKFLSVAPLEPQFYMRMLDLLQITEPAFRDQYNRTHWPALRQQLTMIFASRSRDEWCALAEGQDVCFAPVLDMAEAPAYAHNQARGVFVTQDGVLQPAPAPSLRRTPGQAGSPRAVGADSYAVLRDAGFSQAEIDALQATGAVAQAGS